MADHGVDGPAVRHVVAADHGRLRELRLRALAADPGAFGSTFDGDAAKPEEWWVAWATSSEAGVTERTFVAVVGGAWAGLALVRIADAPPGRAVLNAMWVTPEVRGRGVARTLCDACAAWATGRGCGELVLEVVEGNGTARRAYETAGFVVVGRGTSSVAGRVLHELVMRRALRPRHGGGLEDLAEERRREGARERNR